MVEERIIEIEVYDLKKLKEVIEEGHKLHTSHLFLYDLSKCCNLEQVVKEQDNESRILSKLQKF